MTLPLYEAVRKMRLVAIGRSSLLAIEVPIRELLLKLLTTLA